MSLHNRLAKHGTALKMASGLSGDSINRISFRNGDWSLIKADGTTIDISTKYLDLVLLDANPNTSYQYYSKGFTAGVAVPPDCFSHNAAHIPSVNCGSPQAESCAKCDKRRWDSDTNEETGKQRPACSARKMLAVMPVLTPHDGMDEAYAAEMANPSVYQLNIPPASLKNFRGYMQEVSRLAHPTGNRPLEPFDFITRVTFAKGQNISGQILVFNRQSEPFPDEDLEFIADLLDSGQCDTYTLVHDEPRVGALVAPARQEQIAAPAARPAHAPALHAPTPRQNQQAAATVRQVEAQASHAVPDAPVRAPAQQARMAQAVQAARGAPAPQARVPQASGFRPSQATPAARGAALAANAPAFNRAASIADAQLEGELDLLFDGTE